MRARSMETLVAAGLIVASLTTWAGPSWALRQVGLEEGQDRKQLKTALLSGSPAPSAASGTAAAPARPASKPARPGQPDLRPAGLEEVGPILAHHIERLKSKHVLLREWAAMALREMGEAAAPAAAVLGDALRDPSDDVRFAAVLALWEMGAVAAPAVDALKGALKDKKAPIRFLAASALGKMGAAAAPALPDLQQALQDAKDDDVRSAAARALGKIGPQAAPAIPDLRKALQEEYLFIRSAAEAALGKIPHSGLEEGKPSPARLASEEEKRRLLLEQAQSVEWKDFAAQALAVGTAPKNFRDRLESFRTGAERLLSSIRDPQNMTPEEQGRVQTLLSSLFYTHLQLASHAVQIKTLSDRQKFGGDAFTSEEIQAEADPLLDLLAWAEARFPDQARGVIVNEWQDNLLHLGLADYEERYGADLAGGKKNLGTTLFSNWAEEAARNGHTRLFRIYANFLVEKINSSNPAEAQMATQEVWGHDYGGITTRLGVLLGVNFVMMNPTLVRRSVWESEEATEMVRARVREAKKTDSGITDGELWAHGTFMGGWHARMALYPTFVISRGQEGQVSLQLDPRENSAEEILASLDRFVPWLAEEGARFLDRFVVDAEVVSEEQIREAFEQPDGSSLSKINAVFKVDGSNIVNYSDILEKALEVIREQGHLDLVELGLRTNSLVTRLHRRGIFTNFTAHGRVGIAASLAQWAGNAAARASGVPVHGGYVTQMAGRLDEFLAESALHRVKQELQKLIDGTKGVEGKQEETAGYEGLLADVKKLSQGTQGALNQKDAKGEPTPLGRAVAAVNAERSRRSQPELVIPMDDDVRFFGALVIQRTETLLTPLRAKLVSQGVTTNESAQLLASTRPWEVGGKMVHFFYTTGSSRNIKRGWFPSTGLMPLSRVEKQALRAHLSRVKAAAPGTVVEEVPAGVFDRLADSSLGEIVRQFTEPTLQEAELFERVAGTPNPLQGNGGLALDKLHTTRFMSFTFTGDYNAPKPTTLQEVEEAFDKGRIKGQFLDDARKYQADVARWAQPAGAEEKKPALRPGEVRVLLVEDDATARRMLAMIAVAALSPGEALTPEQKVLENGEIALADGMRVGLFADVRQAVQWAKTNRPQLVLTDYQLIGSTGREVAEAAWESDPSAAVVMMSGGGYDEAWLKEQKQKNEQGVRTFHFVEKPYRPAVIEAQIGIHLLGRLESSAGLEERRPTNKEAEFGAGREPVSAPEPGAESYDRNTLEFIRRYDAILEAAGDPQRRSQAIEALAAVSSEVPLTDRLRVNPATGQVYIELPTPPESVDGRRPTQVLYDKAAASRELYVYTRWGSGADEKTGLTPVFTRRRMDGLTADSNLYQKLADGRIVLLVPRSPAGAEEVTPRRVEQMLDALGSKIAVAKQSKDEKSRKWMHEAEEVGKILGDNLPSLRTVPSGDPLRDQEIQDRASVFFKRAGVLLRQFPAAGAEEVSGEVDLSLESVVQRLNAYVPGTVLVYGEDAYRERFPVFENYHAPTQPGAWFRRAAELHFQEGLRKMAFDLKLVLPGLAWGWMPPPQIVAVVIAHPLPVVRSFLRGPATAIGPETKLDELLKIGDFLVSQEGAIYQITHLLPTNVWVNYLGMDAEPAERILGGPYSLLKESLAGYAHRAGPGALIGHAAGAEERPEDSRPILVEEEPSQLEVEARAAVETAEMIGDEPGLRKAEVWLDHINPTVFSGPAGAGLEEVRKVDMNLYRNPPPESVYRLTRVAVDPAGVAIHSNVFFHDGLWDKREGMYGSFERKGTVGVTTNQAIVQKKSGLWKEMARQHWNAGLSAQDSFLMAYHQEARVPFKALAPLRKLTGGAIGQVSQEASALLSDKESLLTGMRRIDELFQDSSLVKLPNIQGYPIGLPNEKEDGPMAAFERVRHGRSGNVTLGFSVQHFLAHAKAHVEGLKGRVSPLQNSYEYPQTIRENLSRINWVFSLFMSRIDRRMASPKDEKTASWFDQAIAVAEGAGQTADAEELRLLKGKTSVALGRFVGQVMQYIYGMSDALNDDAGFLNPKERQLAERLRGDFAALHGDYGARPLYLLVASSGKYGDQPYATDLQYVLPFLGPGIWNTLPPATLEALSRFVAGKDPAQMEALKNKNLIQEEIPWVEQPDADWDSMVLSSTEELKAKGIETRSASWILKETDRLLLSRPEFPQHTLLEVGNERRDAGAADFRKAEEGMLAQIEQWRAEFEQVADAVAPLRQIGRQLLQSWGSLDEGLRPNVRFEFQTESKRGRPATLGDAVWFLSRNKCGYLQFVPQPARQPNLVYLFEAREVPPENFTSGQQQALQSLLDRGIWAPMLQHQWEVLQGQAGLAFLTELAQRRPWRRVADLGTTYWAQGVVPMEPAAIMANVLKTLTDQHLVAIAPTGEIAVVRRYELTARPDPKEQEAAADFYHTLAVRAAAVVRADHWKLAGLPPALPGPAGAGLEEAVVDERVDRVRVPSAASVAPGKVFVQVADIPAERWIQILGSEPIWLSDIRSQAMGELAVQYGGDFAGEADLAFAAVSVVEGDPEGWNRVFREFRLPAPVVSPELLQGLNRNDLAALAVFLRDRQREGGLVQIRAITIDESKGFREMVIRSAA